jgi:hypothetical protein
MVGVSQFALAALSLSIPVSARRRPCSLSSASYVASTSTNFVSTADSTPTSTPGSNDNASVTSALAQEAATGTSAVAGVFKPGVTWDICIHYPIKHDTVDDIIPKEAKVWDIDLGHAHDYPTLIPTLKVFIIK